MKQPMHLVADAVAAHPNPKRARKKTQRTLCGRRNPPRSTLMSKVPRIKVALITIGTNILGLIYCKRCLTQAGK